jgi:hypothetical protein
MRKSLPVQIPQWLKDGGFACHLPTRTVFKPERSLRQQEGSVFLVDCNGQTYLFSECDCLRREHLTRGMALLVSEDSDPLTVHPATSSGAWFIVTNGTTRKGVGPMPLPNGEGLRYAQSLSRFFNGAVVTLEPNEIPESLI